MERSVTNALPKLPGFDFSQLSQPQTFARHSTFNLVQGVPFVRGDSTPAARAHASKPTLFTDFAIKEKFPEWRTLQDRVLRVFGYFVEPVAESQFERSMVRHVSLHYHLVDRTFSMNEELPVQNAGLKGGCMVSRHADHNIVLDDLVVGKDVVVRGRTIHIVDCDGFTRNFFSRFGAPQPDAIPYPSSDFEATLKAASVNRNLSKDADQIAAKRVSEMVASNNRVMPLTVEDKQRAQNFLKFDKSVLSFLATWDHRHFRLSYFLSDGTISVNLLHSPNDGRDPTAQFIRRGLIPKDSFVAKTIDTITYPRNTPVTYYTEADLKPGITLTLFGRPFFLYSADEFTRTYYQQKYGVTFEQFPRDWVEGEEPEKSKVLQDAQIPPPTGMGSDADSLGSFKYLVMKPPRKDYAKYIRHANDVLRFAAEFENAAPEDQGRRFIFCYYLADDTVSVYEYAVRNSGHVGGKIFSRSAVPQITPNLLVSGAVFKVGGGSYRLLYPDDRTIKYLETGIHMDFGGEAKAAEQLDRLRQHLTQRFSRVADAYRHYNSTRRGISIVDLKHMFEENEIKVHDENVLGDVMRMVDLDNDGLISLQEFVEGILKQNLTTAQGKFENVPSLSAQTYHQMELQKQRREFGDVVLKKFIARVEARRVFLVDTFRLVSDKSVDGLIGVETFKSVVQDKLGMALTDDELSALVDRFYYVEHMPNYLERRLSLREFRKVIDQ